VAKHLERELARLKVQVLSLSAVVEEHVRWAVEALEKRDEKLAQKVIDADIAVDHAEVDVEEECLKLLALYQPVAIDLRFIVAVLKINNDLERIADHATNIAEDVIYTIEGTIARHRTEDYRTLPPPRSGKNAAPS
jgi:phosphate transport system protein